MKTLNLISLFLFLTLTASCGSDKLDREKASELIQNFYDYPNLAYIELRSDFHCLSISETNKKLINANLLFKKRSYDGNCWHTELRTAYEYEKFVLETKASNLKNTDSVSRYSLAVRTFKEVTGIKFNEDKTEATVEFSFTVSDSTPFGKAMGYEEKEYTFSSNMALFDDGWRVTDKKVTNSHILTQMSFRRECPKSIFKSFRTMTSNDSNR